MSQTSTFYRKTRISSVTFAVLVLVVVLSGCSRMRGAELYIKNDSADPVKVRLHGGQQSPERVEKTILIPSHSEEHLDGRLKEATYKLDVLYPQGRSTSVVISHTFVLDADGGEVCVVLGSGAPRLTASPDRDLVKRQQAALRSTVEFLAALFALAAPASVIHWTRYWRRRRTRA